MGGLGRQDDAFFFIEACLPDGFDFFRYIP
jgi:hypothetical protein